jgi:hypothetical protein
MVKWKNGECINDLLLDTKGTILGNEYVIKCGAVGNSLRNTWELKPQSSNRHPPL